MRREFTEPLPPQNGASPRPCGLPRLARAGIPAGRPDPPVPPVRLRVRARSLFPHPSWLRFAPAGRPKRKKSVTKCSSRTFLDLKSGGRGGIRTPGGRKSSTVFKTAAFNRSATLPKYGHSAGESAECPAFLVAGQTSSGQGVCPDSFKFIAE